MHFRLPDSRFRRSLIYLRFACRSQYEASFNQSSGGFGVPQNSLLLTSLRAIRLDVGRVEHMFHSSSSGRLSKFASFLGTVDAMFMMLFWGAKQEVQRCGSIEVCSSVLC